MNLVNAQLSDAQSLQQILNRIPNETSKFFIHFHLYGDEINLKLT